MVGWDDLAMSVYGASDDGPGGRLETWIRSNTVWPHIEELKTKVNFGTFDAKRAANKEKTIQLCVENEKTGRYIRVHPNGWADFSTKEHYARAIGLIIQENSYPDEVLARKISYRRKCEIVLEMLSLVRQEHSARRRGRFRESVGSSFNNEGETEDRNEIEKYENQISETDEASDQINEQLAKEAEMLRLSLPIKVVGGKPEVIRKPTKQQEWESLPHDVLEYWKLIRMREHSLTTREINQLMLLDVASRRSGALSSDDDLSPEIILNNDLHVSLERDDMLYEEFLNHNGDKGALSIYGVLRAAEKEELQVMVKAHQYFELHANKGPGFEHCVQLLDITRNSDQLWLNGTRTNFTFYPFQIQGIAWMMEMCYSPMRGCILADDMGLGKTVQALGLIQAIVNARSKERDPETRERLYGIAKPTMIVVPPMVLPQWKDEIVKNFPQLKLRKVYAAGTSLSQEDFTTGEESAAQEIILASYTMMEKHSRAAQIKWNVAHPDEDWPLDLGRKVGLLIADEAHMLKLAETGARWTALKLLKADRALAMTGTLLNNKVGDLAGPLGIISNDNLWQTLGVSTAKNPFLFGDSDPRAVLQCTLWSLKSRVMKERDSIRQGLYVQKILSRIMRKTTAATVFLGKLVGESIPPMREQTIQLSHDPVSQEKYLTVAKIYAPKLITLEETKSGHIRVHFHMEIHRVLTIINIWYPLHHIADQFHTKSVQKFRKEGGDLRDLLDKMEYSSTYRWQAVKPIATSSNEELIITVARTSPIIRFILQTARNIVVCLKRKLIVWTDYPLAQLFVELTLNAAGFNVESLHSGMDSDSRNTLIRRFNDARSSIQVLVMSTLVGSVGLNLQHACSDQIMAGTTASDPQERQALARLCRIGQSKQVSAWKVVVENSYAEGIQRKRFMKVVCELVAHLDESKLIGEGRISDVSRFADIGREIEQLWCDLNGVLEVPKKPDWLARGELFFALNDQTE